MLITYFINCSFLEQTEFHTYQDLDDYVRRKARELGLVLSIYYRTPFNAARYKTLFDIDWVKDVSPPNSGQYYCKWTVS